MTKPAAYVEEGPGKDEHSHTQPDPPVCIQAYMFSIAGLHKGAMQLTLDAQVMPLEQPCKCRLIKSVAGGMLCCRGISTLAYHTDKKGWRKVRQDKLPSLTIQQWKALTTRVGTEAQCDA